MKVQWIVGRDSQHPAGWGLLPFHVFMVNYTADGAARDGSLTAGRGMMDWREHDGE